MDHVCLGLATSQLSNAKAVGACRLLACGPTGRLFKPVSSKSNRSLGYEREVTSERIRDKIAAVTERGRAGLAANRKEHAKLLWRLWSPNWKFNDATYDRTAASFDNPDFVEIVSLFYRHRFG